MEKLLNHLAFLYGENNAPQIYERAQKLMTGYRAQIPKHNSQLTERDSLLITYGDQIQTQHEKPLQTLGAFCKTYLTDVVSGIHILPFYPWTSDDGF